MFKLYIDSDSDEFDEDTREEWGRHEESDEEDDALRVIFGTRPTPRGPIWPPSRRCPPWDAMRAQRRARECWLAAPTQHRWEDAEPTPTPHQIDVGILETSRMLRWLNVSKVSPSCTPASLSPSPDASATSVVTDWDLQFPSDSSPPPPIYESIKDSVGGGWKDPETILNGISPTPPAIPDYTAGAYVVPATGLPMGLVGPTRGQPESVSSGASYVDPDDVMLPTLTDSDSDGSGLMWGRQGSRYEEEEDRWDIF